MVEESKGIHPEGLRMYQASVFSPAPIQTLVGKGPALQLDLVANTSGAVLAGECFKSNT